MKGGRGRGYERDASEMDATRSREAQHDTPRLKLLRPALRAARLLHDVACICHVGLDFIPFELLFLIIPCLRFQRQSKHAAVYRIVHGTMSHEQLIT